MSIKSMISRLPVIGHAVARSMGWQTTMFGDLMGGGSDTTTGDLTRPYAKSAWVHSAIGFVAGPIAMRPLLITADRRGGDVPVEHTELTSFWERPAKTCGGLMNRQDFMESTVGLLKLKGQCFWIMDDSWLLPRGKKNPLILARPDSMHAVIEHGELIGWSYTNNYGSRSALIPDQVQHLKFWNPYHEWMGLSEWEAAQLSAESDYASGVFARNLARNNGDRGPFVVGKGGTFTDDQIKQVSAQLRAKRELGRRGEFRAAFLPADVEVVEPGLKSVDSEFVGQRLENRKETYIAFGVPPSYADPQASYSIGSASDRFRLIEDTCMPLGAKIADAMEVVSQAFLGTKETIFVEFDWDSHSTMQAVRTERFEVAIKGVEKGIPWKVAGDYFNLKLPRFAGDHIGRIPFNLTEIEPDGSTEPKPTTGKDNPIGSSDTTSDALDELEKVFSKALHDTSKAGAIDKNQHKKRTTEIWQRVRKNREPWEKKFKTKISRYLMDARAETLRNIAAAASGQEKSVVTKDIDLLSIIFNLDEWLSEWTKGLSGISRAAIEQAGIELWRDELDRDDPLTLPANEVLQALQGRQNKIKGAGQKVWESIKAELEQGITQGETMDNLAERVRRKFALMDKTRSLTIAKTETTVIYEQGRDMTFRAAGVEWTEWVTSGLDATRHNTYSGLNGQRCEVGEKFKVGLVELAFPGDPEGPADEVINCNCVRIAVGGADAGNIIGNDDDEIPY